MKKILVSSILSILLVLFLSDEISAGVSTPVGCSISPSGTLQTQQGKTLTITASCTATDANLSKIGIDYSSVNSESWTVQECLLSGKPSQTCTKNITWQTPGTYYVESRAVSASGKKCSANPWCEWPPDTSISRVCTGFSDCGTDDLLTVEVLPPNTPTVTPPPVQSNPDDTFSIVISTKTINDFNNPLPSIKLFFDNYQNVMKKYSNKIVMFFVGSGDHIYSYPPNAFNNPPVSTKGIITNTLPTFTPNTATGFNGAQVQLVSSDTYYPGYPGIKVSVTDPIYGIQALKGDLFLNGQGISLHDFPVISWAWKKSGGASIVIQFKIRNKSTGVSKWVGYFAGDQLPQFTKTNWAQFRLGDLPLQWTEQKINLKQDLFVYAWAAANIYGHDSEMNDWEVVGIALAPMDGSYAMYNNIHAETSTGINWDRFCRGLNCWDNLPTTQPFKQIGRDYPQELTYLQLKNIFQLFKSEALARGLSNFKILDGVEAGPEFSNQEWKYYRHPESIKNMPPLTDPKILNIEGSLNINTKYKYSAYPLGITSPTPISDFVSNQIGKYVNEMEIDGIYSTNDFGVWNQWTPYGNCTFSGTTVVSCPNYMSSHGNKLVTFLKNIKTKMGPGKIHVWMDTYFPVNVNYNYFSIPDTAYDQIDYLQISTFYQDVDGNPTMPNRWLWDESSTFVAGALKGQKVDMRQTITSEIALKETHPNLKLLWTSYFNDPWYDAGYGEATSFSGWNQYKGNLDGIVVYSSNYKGEHIPQNWLLPLGGSVTPSPVVLVGDANNDGKVDMLDYSVWKANYGQTNVTSGALSGDFNNNNQVDGVDYVLWLINYSI